MQLGGRAAAVQFLHQQPEHAAGVDRAQLLRVSGHHGPRARGAGDLLDQGRIGRADLACLVND